jgi:hypothetical protein
VAEQNIVIILGGLAAALCTQVPGHIRGFLAGGLVWEGVEPGLRCDGLDQAMGVIRNGSRRRR